MVSPTKLKNGEAELSKLLKNKGVCRKQNPSALLKGKKFVLCLKNHSLQSKYEIQLRTFGASVVTFIDKEVNYVLTDALGYNGKSAVVVSETSHLSPLCHSVSPTTSTSGDDFGMVKRVKTRTEAMLERVSVQSRSVATLINPIHSALALNIPVYSLDYFQTLLDKKLSHIRLSSERIEANNERNIRIFENKYLKLEHIIGNRYRPDFKEVSKWPSIDTNSLIGTCPFENKSYRTSARKNRNHANNKKSERMNRICNKTANEAGYCEICCEHYADLSQHVTTGSHLKFICNDSNYAELDNCIKTRSIDAFLAGHHSGDNSCLKELSENEEMGRNMRKSVSLLNNNNENSVVTKSLNNSKYLADESLKQPLLVQCNGFTTYHLRKANIKSDSVLMKGSGICNNKDSLHENRKMYVSYPDTNNSSTKDLVQISSVEEDGLHRLRSRKSLLLPAILIGTTAEDSNKNRNPLSPQTPTSNHFLRSSSSPKSQADCPYATRSKLPVEDGCKKINFSDSLSFPKQSLNVQLKKSKLNNTSCESSKKLSRTSVPSLKDEVCMNGLAKPYKRKCSITTSDNDEKHNIKSFSFRNVPTYSSNKQLKNTSYSTDVDKNGQCRKRLSVDEKFLEDNKEYYKVEMLPKLRSTEFYCNREASSTSMRKEEKKEVNLEESNSLRLKKQRQSALQLLNLEATNFLFGPTKRGDADRSSEEDDEAKVEVKSAEKNGSENKKQLEKIKPSSCSNSSKPVKRQMKGKKRRTHSEVFLHDNLDYYKFEISDSRLRHSQHTNESSSQIKCELGKSFCSSTTSYSSPSTSIQNNTAKIEEEVVTDNETETTSNRKRAKTKKNVCLVEEQKVDIKSVVDKEDLPVEEIADNATESCLDRPPPPTDSVRFAFESIPYKEQWFKAFQRFDSCQEEYIPISNTAYFSRYRDVFPISFGRRLCDAEKNISPASRDHNLLDHFRRRRKQRISRLIIDDNPRKSPRCHASTLAILSSLTRRRSRKLLSAVSPVKGFVSNVIASRTADLENKSLLAEVSREHEARIKEAMHLVAKDMDEYFVSIFSKDDCGDIYCKFNGEFQPADEPPDRLHCCMQIDISLLRDREFLKTVAEDRSNFPNNMSEFIESSEQCTSMEIAQDEELIIPRSYDPFSRLWRENDFSGNSSDCGASSTCEFLGFAEDGRTVSRKRKRKRPNMTGWPHDKNKNRQIRILRLSSNVEGGVDRKSVDIANEDQGQVNKREGNGSDQDADSTDDDVPLKEFIFSKRRRTNNSLSASEDVPLKVKLNKRKNASNNVTTPTLRTPKISPLTSSRRSTPILRRKPSLRGRRTRYSRF